MGIRLEFEAHGDKLVARELTRFAARGLDATPAFDEIADDFMAAEKRRFATKGNGTWNDIAVSTRAKKRASKDPRVRANASRILVATGAMRRSFTVKGDPNQVLITQPQFMVFGSSLDRADYHQKGKGVPVRKPLGFTENAKRNALRTLQRYIVTGEVNGSLAFGGRSRSV